MLLKVFVKKALDGLSLSDNNTLFNSYAFIFIKRKQISFILSALSFLSNPNIDRI